MAEGIDVFQLFPELAAIGQRQLQAYCNEWLRRPIATKYGVSLISVSHDLLLSINLDPARTAHIGDRVFLPIDELLGYIVEQHFADGDQRRRLYRLIRDTKHNWAECGREYGASMGRTGKLYLTCKNPDCRAELDTGQEGVEGWKVTVPPAELTCPKCGFTAVYEGSDLHLLPPIG